MSIDKVKKSYILAKLKERPEASKSQWLVEFWAWNPNTDALKRKQIKVPLKYETPAQKRLWAKGEIKRINEALVGGATFKLKPAVGSDTQSKDIALPKPKKLIDAIDELLTVKFKTLRKKSHSTYQSDAVKFRAFLKQNQLTHILPNEIPAGAGFKFLDYLKSIGNCNKTANNRLQKVNGFLRELKQRGHDIGKGLEFKKLPVTDSVRNVAFTPEHQLLLESWLLKNDYDMYLFTRFMYHAFIRPRELRQLSVTHVDINRQIILVPANISKNRKTEQTAINQTLFGLLREINAKMDTALQHIAKAHTVKQNNLLFSKGVKYRGSGRCAENAPYNRHRAALVACGLDGFGYTLYSWKHTGVVRAFESGLNLKRLQALLRHSSLSITDIYLRSLNLRIDNENLAGW